LLKLVGCVQSRSNTPRSRSRSPALDHVLAANAVAATAQLDLAAVSSDVRHAFAGAGVGTTGLGLGPGSYPRPSTGGLVPGSSPGVSRDLLEATDYITGAVTSLVKELHSGNAVGTITITIIITIM